MQGTGNDCISKGSNIHKFSDPAGLHPDNLIRIY